MALHHLLRRSIAVDTQGFRLQAVVTASLLCAGSHRSRTAMVSVIQSETGLYTTMNCFIDHFMTSFTKSRLEVIFKYTSLYFYPFLYIIFYFVFIFSFIHFFSEETKKALPISPVLLVSRWCNFFLF